MKATSSFLAPSVGAGSVLLLCCFAGCSSASTPPSSSTGDDGGVAQDAATSGRDATPVLGSPGDDFDAALPFEDGGTTYIRLMNLSPDAPALDFCISETQQTQYHGPVLAKLAGGGDAAAAGLAYGQASGYIAYPSNSYDIMLVAAGSTDCSASIGPFSASTSTLDDGVFATLAVMGDVSPTGNDASIGTHTLLDDTTATGNGIVLRFVNASSSVASVDFGNGAGASFTPLFLGVPFGDPGTQTAADAGTEDPDDYLPFATPSSDTMSAHSSTPMGDAGLSDLARGKVTLTADHPGTVFLIGGKTGDATHPLQLLACEDGAAMYPSAPKCTIASP